MEVEDRDDDPRLLALEAEIYDFMVKSAKPTHFPTKDELIAAGRMDLVEAIAVHGGYLAYGCDFDDDDDEAAGADDGYGDHGDGGDVKERGGQLQGGEWRDDAISSFPLETEPATVALDDNEVAVGWQDDEVLQQQRLILLLLLIPLFRLFSPLIDQFDCSVLLLLSYARSHYVFNISYCSEKWMSGKRAELRAF